MGIVGRPEEDLLPLRTSNPILENKLSQCLSFPGCVGWIGDVAHPEGRVTFSKGLLRQGLSCACSAIPVFHLLDLQPPFPDILSVVVRGRGENGIREL